MFRAADAARRDEGRDVMEQVRRGTGGVAAGRTALVILRIVLRAALLTLPLLALRAMFWPREQPLSGLSDSQLLDIGLTRADVTRPHERPTAAELEIRRLL